MVTANAFAIEGNLELLTQLDFIFAKANLSHCHGWDTAPV